MIKSRKSVTGIALIFAAIYMVSYLTRINFGAVVSEMEQATGISKKLLSLSLTGSFITYGIGQIISGVTADRLSPKKLISIGLGITTAMNLLLPLCSNPYAMLGVWCVNGFAQSMMWPPIVIMMSQLFDDAEYEKAAVIICGGSSAGTIVVYLLAPVVVSVLNWKWLFVICGCVAALTLALWQLFRYTPKKEVAAEKQATGNFRIFLSPLILGIMCAIVLQGMLRDGVTTWMPSYITEVYNWDTAASILAGVILPIFSLICVEFATILHKRLLKNPLSCAGAFFALGTVSAVCLFMVTGGNAVLSVGFSALLTGAMHGVNMMLISMLPPYFKRFGLTGTASGLLNSCTYIGSALSTYGIATISEATSWSFTVLLWSVIALLGMILCFGCAKVFAKKFR